MDSTIAMQNAQSFLYLSAKKEIHLILHGHKHRSGVLQLGFPQLNKQKEKNPLVISSCASSSKPSEESIEIKLYDFTPMGGCKMSVYNANPTNDLGFTLTENKTTNIINDHDRRYSLSTSLNNLGIIESKGIKRATSKTKHIRIVPNGGAITEISYEGIEFDNTTCDHTIIERLRLDSGRIFNGEYAFDTRNRAFEKWAKIWDEWDHPKKEAGEKLESLKSETFEYHFKLPEKQKSLPDKTCRIFYRQQNGYALTSTQHEEIYDWNDAKYHEEPQENCSIQANFPMDTIELVIQFPKAYYPDPTSFRLNAIKKESITEEQEYSVLKELGTPIEEETDYLSVSGALTVRDNFNEISLRVENPRLDAVYSIYWNVPTDTYSYELTRSEQALVDALRSEFLTQNSRLTSFYNDLTVSIRQELDDDSLQIFLFGYNRESTCLEVIGNPNPSRFDSLNAILVGRGVAGAAFTRRTNAYWDDDTNDLCLENTVEGLDPKAVQAFPLSYPWNFKDLIKAREGQKDRDPWPFAVVSIVSEKYDSPLFLSSPGTTQRKVNKKAYENYRICDTIIDSLLLIHYGRFVSESLGSEYIDT